MPRPVARLMPSLLAALLTAGSFPALTRAANPIDVKFVTFDRVELHGTFYPPKGGKKSPCAILVHKLGGSRQQAGWDDVVTALQKQDFAVLTFDFRGHGESVAVDPQTFWAVRANAFLIKGANIRKDKIAYKEFNREYIPMLANDLAAAKKFLNEQNNAGLCNSSSVTIVGADDGAAVAALWIASEWLRPRVQRDFSGRILGPATLGGTDLAGAVWLSIPSSLDHVSVASWFRGYIPSNTERATIGEKTPMALLYGKRDSAAASAAKTLLSVLAGRNKQSLSVAHAKEGKNSGIDLVAQGAVSPDDDIVSYLSGVLEKRTSGSWVHKEPSQLEPIALSWFGFTYLR